jgi:ubiquinone/menaquinone biosynthesis C-methylase UbiE
MQRQTIFKSLAKHYDLLYSWKDYKKEVEILRELIRTHKTSPGTDLLELACGTGKHAELLQDDFSIVAADLNEDMLRIARARCRRVSFVRADMVSFELGRQFDVVLCLFSSIGYVRTRARLKKTLANFARHLKAGGVAIIEPWWTKTSYRVGAVTMTSVGNDDVKIARQCVCKVRGDVSIMDMHYLIGERNKAVTHHVDRHELGLFERRGMLAAMRQAGLRAHFEEQGLMPDRGLYIAVKA